MKTPGSAVSLWLGVAAILTLPFPILSLPCSITGLVLGKRARSFERQEFGVAKKRTSQAYYLCLAAMIITLAIMVYAIPGAIERNLT